MSVLRSKRRESSIAAVAYAVDVQKILLEFAQRNFGVKDVDHVVRMKYAFSRETKEDFYKYWYIMHAHKTEINKNTILLTNYVYAAKEAYPNTLDRLKRRQENQELAISTCKILIKELQSIADVFEVDLNTFKPSIQALKHEIRLIKNWRAKNKKFKKALQLS